MTIVPADNRTIARMKQFLMPVMIHWIDSLHLDENNPMQWVFHRGRVHDLDKEVGSEWACWKPDRDLTVTIIDGDKEYKQIFIETDDGWKLDADVNVLFSSQ